ncbi:MAG: CCA tRNA nucleotidyltransferase [Marinilabiliaceae bacterium]|nr:CCA tRNA nucleotidyltransferase [Marinilabiliaceae bacterium]
MQDFLKHPVFKTVSDICYECGYKAYTIGGFVRDIFLHRKNSDIDIVIIGNGIEVAEKTAKKMGGYKVSVYKAFGTAMFRCGDSEIEFVGARKESYNRYSRKPIVEIGTLEDDQNRRDFTINALAISLNKENYGELIDPFGGIKDLDKGIIKTPLDPMITFSDDPLRIIRAVRFATQLGFNIEQNTFDGIISNRERLSIVSPERIIDELNKIVLAERPSIGFMFLDKAGLLQDILPELNALKGVETVDGKGHKDNFYHTLEVLDNISPKTDDLWLRWAAIFHDIAKPVTKKFDPQLGWTFHAHNFVGEKMIPNIFKRLKFPLNEKMKFVQKMVSLHLRPIALVEEEVTDSALRRLLFEAGDDLESLMTLCEADITSKNKEKVAKLLANFKVVRQKLKETEEKDRLRNFQPPITGEIIMDTFNLPPSHLVGVIKSAIKDAILDGIIRNDYTEAYQFMLLKGKELGL